MKFKYTLYIVVFTISISGHYAFSAEKSFNASSDNTYFDASESCRRAGQSYIDCNHPGEKKYRAQKPTLVAEDNFIKNLPFRNRVSVTYECHALKPESVGISIGNSKGSVSPGSPPFEADANVKYSGEDLILSPNFKATNIYYGDTCKLVVISNYQYIDLNVLDTLINNISDHLHEFSDVRSSIESNDSIDEIIRSSKRALGHLNRAHDKLLLDIQNLVEQNVNGANDLAINAYKLQEATIKRTIDMLTNSIHNLESVCERDAGDNLLAQSCNTIINDLSESIKAAETNEIEDLMKLKEFLQKELLRLSSITTDLDTKINALLEIIDDHE